MASGILTRFFNYLKKNCVYLHLFFHSRTIGSRQGSPSNEGADLNKNGSAGTKDVENISASNSQILDGHHNMGPALDHHHTSGPPYASGPPGLNDQPMMPPFQGGSEAGLGPHMIGGHPNGGPSPPIQTTGLPPLGGPLSGLESMMDLQTVGHHFLNILNIFLYL